MEALCTAKWARAYVPTLWPRTPNFAFLTLNIPLFGPALHLSALLPVLAPLGAAALLLLLPVFLVNASVWVL